MCASLPLHLAPPVTGQPPTAEAVPPPTDGIAVARPLFRPPLWSAVPPHLLYDRM
jgi:hypothetical protein